MTHDLIQSPDPWSVFAEWLAQAEGSESSYPNAMMLATVGAEGMPSARTVLMKWFDPLGLIFYTNKQSRKGEQIAQNPKAAASFYWRETKRQVRFEGCVSEVLDAESDAYFATRSRDNQIGAWASEQSRTIESRTALDERVLEIERRFAGAPVPRPPHWGGYRLAPTSIEFWQEGNHRLHDRLVYRKEGKAWQCERLCP